MKAQRVSGAMAVALACAMPQIDAWQVPLPKRQGVALKVSSKPLETSRVANSSTDKRRASQTFLSSSTAFPQDAEATTMVASTSFGNDSVDSTAPKTGLALWADDCLSTYWVSDEST